MDIPGLTGINHSYLNNSSGMKNSGYCKSWWAPISLKLPWICSRAQVTLSFIDLTNRCKTLHVILYQSDVESLLWALGQLHGSFSDIGAHQDLQKPNFVMPELLLKELWDYPGLRENAETNSPSKGMYTVLSDQNVKTKNRLIQLKIYQRFIGFEEEVGVPCRGERGPGSIPIYCYFTGKLTLSGPGGGGNISPQTFGRLFSNN